MRFCAGAPPAADRTRGSPLSGRHPKSPRSGRHPGGLRSRDGTVGSLCATRGLLREGAAGQGSPELPLRRSNFGAVPELGPAGPGAAARTWGPGPDPGTPRPLADPPGSRRPVHQAPRVPGGAATSWRVCPRAPPTGRAGGGGAGRGQLPGRAEPPAQGRLLPPLPGPSEPPLTCLPGSRVRHRPRDQEPTGRGQAHDGWSACLFKSGSLGRLQRAGAKAGAGRCAPPPA